MVEVYPLNVKVVHSAKANQYFEMIVSRSTTVQQFKEDVLKLTKWEGTPSGYRAWTYSEPVKLQELKDGTTVDDANVYDKSKVLFEPISANDSSSSKGKASSNGYTPNGHSYGNSEYDKADSPSALGRINHIGKIAIMSSIYLLYLILVRLPVRSFV